MSKLIYIVSRLINRRPVSIKNSKINKKAVIGNGAQIVDSCIGKYTYIYESSVIATNIGSFCSIAADCTIGGGSHPDKWVSTSPVFYVGRNCLRKNFSKNKYNEYKKTIIGNDVWIGSKCLIKSGISIGDCSIIGMGSVVTHDVPPYEIWAGNPARFIRKRFDNETIEKLKKIEWWNFSEEKLFTVGDYFNNPQNFIDYVENEK